MNDVSPQALLAELAREVVDKQRRVWELFYYIRRNGAKWQRGPSDDDLVMALHYNVRHTCLALRRLVAAFDSLASACYEPYRGSRSQRRFRSRPSDWRRCPIAQSALKTFAEEGRRFNVHHRKTVGSFGRLAKHPVRVPRLAIGPITRHILNNRWRDWVQYDESGRIIRKRGRELGFFWVHSCVLAWFTGFFSKS